MILITTFCCKSNQFNDDHVDMDEKQPMLYYSSNDSEAGIFQGSEYVLLLCPKSELHLSD